MEVWEGGSNDLENFRALVKDPCHFAKSAAATARRAKADRQRRYQEKGKGRAPTKGVIWRWRTFSGEIKSKRS